MTITTDLTFVLGVVMVLSFVVNIVVQLTKGIVPIPTKLWCVIVSVAVDMGSLFGVFALGVIKFSAAYVIFSVIGSFIVAYIAMYGFDTFKELWQRFKKGENING